MQKHPAAPPSASVVHHASKLMRAGLSLLFTISLIGTAQPASAAPARASSPQTPLVLAPAAGSVPSPSICYATIDGVLIYSSVNATAVQQAVDAAAPGDTVKVAGTCAGVQTRDSTTQTVYISKTLTLQGGYTNTLSGWLISDPATNPTALDAQAGGRGIRATAAVTVSNLTVQNGNALVGSGGGAFFQSTATLTGTTFTSNTSSVHGGGAWFFGTATLTGTTFTSNTAGSDNGGGAYFLGTATLTGTTFTSNTAGTNGGGAWFAAPPLTGTTFTSNSAARTAAAYTFSTRPR